VLEPLNPHRTGRAAATGRRILRVLAWLLAPVLLYWVAGLLIYRFVTPAVTPLMLIRSLERGEMIWQQGVPLEGVAQALREAVVVAEDSNFCLHSGIDLHAAKDALDDYVVSGRLRGASTITMQVARNLFLWPGGGAPRKALEIPLALALDALWPKWRILEVYLRIAEMGPGIFGAEAAARSHFGVPAARLGPAQAALIAAVLPSPNRWSAAEPSDYVRERARAIRSESTRLSAAQRACLAPP
jgi:monofunctional biosynthetic peptidoglycan transglycosylase